MRPNRLRRVLRVEALEDRLVPATFTVINTDDSGGGSLRQAITDANNNTNSGGPDRIEFNIPGAGVHTIRPDFFLPDITDSVIIDGYTQPGANTLAVGNNAVLRIEINGDNAGESTGLLAFAPDVTIRGLIVNGFNKGTSSTQGRGIVVLGSASSNVVIAGNFVGVDPSGTSAVANENVGIFVLEAPGVRLGGPDPADRNVVSGNGIRGIFINAPNAQIKGNYVGTNAAGTSAIPNVFDGVFVAKNTGYQIGGAGPGEGNVISGNGFTGVTLNGVTDSFVQGNQIGVGADGTTPLGNGDAGVFISNQAASNINNLIGGPTTASNVIAFNARNGISMNDPSGSGNRFQGNSIFENGLLGIDLDKDGPTTNDLGDSDVGANGRQNKPVLTSAPIIAGAARINGSLNSIANETFRVEFFSVPIGDAAGGEGQTFLGATEISSDLAGNATFQVIFSVPEGTVISSTATRLSTRDTSEFSNNVTASTAQGGTISGTVFDDRDGDGQRDASEPLLAGVLVILDGNGNGGQAVVSGADGSYSLTSPVDGTFTVLVQLSTGARQTGLLAGVSLIAGNAIFGHDVGIDLPSARRFALAAGTGGPALVQVFDAADGRLRENLVAFAGFNGGVTVAQGDVNGDGVPDLVAATATATSHVKVFDGLSGAEVRSFLAFAGFNGGVNVGAWDVNGDGFADLIVGTATGASHVKVFSGADGSLLCSFIAFDGFTGGVNVASGDVNGDGFDDVIVGTATGAAHVKVFSGRDLTLLRSFFAYAGFNGGVTVASGDVNGDGIDDVITGTATAASHVKTFDGQNLSLLSSLLAFPGFAGGVSVAGVDRDGDGKADLVVGAGPGTGTQGVIVRATDLALLDTFFAVLPGFSGGLNVAGR